MKHDESTGGNSTERGKIASGFYSAWSPDLGQRERYFSGADGEQQRNNGGRMAEEARREGQF